MSVGRVFSASADILSAVTRLCSSIFKVGESIPGYSACKADLFILSNSNVTLPHILNQLNAGLNDRSSVVRDLLHRRKCIDSFPFSISKVDAVILSGRRLLNIGDNVYFNLQRLGAAGMKYVSMAGCKRELRFVPIKELVASCGNSAYDDFCSLYLSAFPADERRDVSQQLSLVQDNPNYNCLMIYDRKSFIGFLASWKLDETIFIEHMAVREDLRNKGYGTEILRHFVREASLPVVLEVERPGHTQYAERRIHFYLSHGFVLNKHEYYQPSYSLDGKLIPMHIMSHSRELDDEAFSRIRSAIYRVVYGTDI